MSISLDPQTLKALEKKHLRYMTDDIPGIRRMKKGKDFTYLDPNGVNIHNPNILERIKQLNIPPAWKDVWINPHQHGHLQATGYDSKGRKQYIYHPLWTEICQENKFNHISTFYQCLPKIRNFTAAHLGMNKLVKEKILATVVWLLENTLIRVGNEEYARDNNSFGLTTLREKHIVTSGKDIIFEFKGKSGIKHTVKITHPTIVKTVKKCVELPGYELFQYIDENNDRHVVDSADVNEYLKDITGKDITAKDFRTWGGSVLCSTTLYQIGPFTDEPQSQKNIAQAVKKVSNHLRNTPKVCRNYYIHPLIIGSYQKSILIPYIDKLSYSGKPRELTKDEYAVVSLLKKYS